ncbi:hypothetical protein HNQ56_001107 [Anaerotaenia torta]|uniref:hypothetical protein n=1 Tax=Anaerotaenia torta TaxID=433293 RepID=UPI003D1A8E7B
MKFRLLRHTVRGIKAIFIIAVIGFMILHLSGNSQVSQAGSQEPGIRSAVIISLGFAASIQMMRSSRKK